MSFQWNQSAPASRQDGSRTQPMPHWSNPEQYNPGNMTANQYPFQETGTTSADWNSGSYNQWFPSTSQDQMNWPCQSMYPPANAYSNPVMPQTTFPSNVYQQQSYPQAQSKSSYRDSFAPSLYSGTEKNTAFNYEMTNSYNMAGLVVAPGQVNDSYRMAQSNLVNNSNCQELSSNKACGSVNHNTAFPYWDSSREVSTKPVEFMPQSSYMSRACDNMPTMSHMGMKTPKMESTRADSCAQNEMLQKFSKRSEAFSHSPVLPNESVNSRLPSHSLSPSSEYYMGMMPQHNTSSNMVPVQKHGNQNNTYNSSFCSMNPHSGITSSYTASEYRDTVKNIPGGDFNYGNKLKSTTATEMTSFPRENELRNERLVQKRPFSMERAPHNPPGYGKKKRMVEQTFFEKSFLEMYPLNRDMMTMETQNQIEGVQMLPEMGTESMIQNLPSYIGPSSQGSHCNDDFRLTNENQNELSDTNSSVKSFKRGTGDVKGGVLQNPADLQSQSDHDPLPENCFPKSFKNEEKINLIIAKKGSGKKLRRAVLKYLLKLSGVIEKCFCDLRNVKKRLKEDQNDLQVTKLLCKIGLQINQTRLSLKEKKKLCEKNNINLRNLTIKSTGDKIMETLEADMYHLRKFYTALNHISRNLDIIKKPSNEMREENPSCSGSFATPSTSHISSQSHSFDDSSERISANDFETHSSPEDTPFPGNGIGSHSARNKNNTKEIASFNAPPQKSAQFMYLERRYWDKLNELNFLLRSKNIEMKSVQHKFKKGDKESAAKLRSTCEAPCTNLKNDVKLLFHWKNKYNFPRKIPSYILKSHPEEERWTRDKMTMKSLQKDFDTFMKLSHKAKVLLKAGASCPNDTDADILMKEESMFWQRLVTLMQKMKLYHSELDKLKMAMSSDRQINNNNHFDTLIRLEGRVGEIDFEFKKEEKIRRKNCFSESMPTNVETEKLKLNSDECRDINTLKDFFQSLRTTIADLKCSFQPNPELSQAINPSAQTTGQASAPLQIQPKKEVQLQQVPSDLAHFLGEVSNGWI